MLGSRTFRDRHVRLVERTHDSNAIDDRFIRGRFAQAMDDDDGVIRVARAGQPDESSCAKDIAIRDVEDRRVYW